MSVEALASRFAVAGSWCHVLLCHDTERHLKTSPLPFFRLVAWSIETLSKYRAWPGGGEGSGCVAGRPAGQRAQSGWF